MLFRVAENASQNNLFLQWKCTTFGRNPQKVMNSNCQYKGIWDAFSATQNTQSSNDKTWFFELPKTHLRTLCFLQWKCITFGWNPQKVLHFNCKYQGFGDAFSATQNTKFSNDKTCFFEMPETHLKTICFYNENALPLGEIRKKVMYFDCKYKGFWDAFSATQNTKFPMIKLAFSSCRKRISKPFVFTMKMHYFWVESTKSAAFQL